MLASTRVRIVGGVAGLSRLSGVERRPQIATNLNPITKTPTKPRGCSSGTGSPQRFPAGCCGEGPASGLSFETGFTVLGVKILGFGCLGALGALGALNLNLLRLFTSGLLCEETSSKLRAYSSERQ